MAKQYRLAVLLAVAVLFTLSACGKQTITSQNDNDTSSLQQQTDIPWTQLDQLTTYTSTGFRGEFDSIFNINKVTTQQGNTKQGCLYVVSENGEEHQSGNTSLRDAFRNKAFMGYWNDAKVQNALAESVELAYTDIDHTSQYAVFASLNAYYNLFNDVDNDDTYGATQSLTREQFMTLLFKAGNGVHDLGDYTSFQNAVVSPNGNESYYTKYAAQVADHSYLTPANGSLNPSNIATPISKLEAVYMVVDAYLKSEVDTLLSSNPGKLSAFGYKDAGDQIAELGINSEEASSSIENNLLAYLVDTQGEKEIDHTLMAYLTVAEQNGLANGITLANDLFTSITKDEAIRLLTNTFIAENSLYGYLTTGEYAELDTIEGVGITGGVEQAGEYIVDINNIPDDLLFAFEYGYSAYHTGEETISEAEKLPLELDTVRNWCTTYVIGIPDNLDTLYPEWRTQYEASLSGDPVDDGTPQDTSGNQQTSQGSQQTSGGQQTSQGGQQASGNNSKPSNSGSSQGSSGGNGGSSSSGSGTSGDWVPTDEDLANMGITVPGVNAPTSGSGTITEGEGYTPDPKDLVNGNTGGFHT